LITIKSKAELMNLFRIIKNMTCARSCLFQRFITKEVQHPNWLWNPHSPYSVDTGDSFHQRMKQSVKLSTCFHLVLGLWMQATGTSCTSLSTGTNHVYQLQTRPQGFT